MRKVLLLFGVFVGTLGISQAQPVIQSDIILQLQGKRDDARMYYADTTSLTALQTLFDLTGENQTWDFTTLSYEETPIGKPIDYLSYQADLPGAQQFADANLVLFLSDSSYIYTYVSDTAWNALGGALNDTLTFALATPYPIWRFPLSYGSSWSWSIAVDSLSYLNFTGFQVDTTTLGQYGDQRVIFRWEVDGYGTLQTPAGNVPVLRITRALWISTGQQPPLPTEVEVARQIEFVTPDLSISAWINAGLIISGFPPTMQMKVTDGGYTVHNFVERSLTAVDEPVQPDAFSLALFPNPAKETAHVELSLPTGAPLTLRVYNVLGQEMITLRNDWLSAGHHTLKLPMQDLAPGVYLIQVQTPTTTQSRTFIHVQ